MVGNITELTWRKQQMAMTKKQKMAAAGGAGAGAVGLAGMAASLRKKEETPDSRTAVEKAMDKSKDRDDAAVKAAAKHHEKTTKGSDAEPGDERLTGAGKGLRKFLRRFAPGLQEGQEGHEGVGIEEVAIAAGLGAIARRR